MPDDNLARHGISLRRLLPLVLLAGAGVAFVLFGGSRYLTFAALAENREWLCGLAARSGILAGFLYIAAYAVLVALSVPGGVVLTIAGGFLFGTWLGALCAVIGATLGAIGIFLAARAGLGGLARRAGPFIGRLEAGFRADAFNYLLVLRLVPIFPFWLVNLVPALVGVETADLCARYLSRHHPRRFRLRQPRQWTRQRRRAARSRHRVPAERADADRRARRSRPSPGLV